MEKKRIAIELPIETYLQLCEDRNKKHSCMEIATYVQYLLIREAQKSRAMAVYERAPDYRAR